MNDFRKLVLLIDNKVDDIRKPLYLVYFVGLIAFILYSRLHIFEVSLHAFLDEIGVIGIFISGVLLSSKLQRPFKLSVIFWLYIFGLTFEIIFEDKWVYKHIVFAIRDDISITFPLGWVGLSMICITLSEFLYCKVKAVSIVEIRDNLLHRFDIVIWILIGTISETTFYRTGMIDQYCGYYFMGMSPLGPPWIILIFYGIFPGFVISMMVRYLGWDAPILLPFEKKCNAR